jgi:putative transcriptional regulator
MITYQRLWETMKKRGITQYHLIKREKFSAGQIGRLKNNQTVSTQTLDTLCRLLSCRIEDIVTYIPDGGEHLPDQTSPLPSKKVTKSEKPDKSDKTEKSDKKNKKKSKKKNKDKDKKQGD